MNFRKLTAAILAILMMVPFVFAGCNKNVDETNSIALVSKDTVLQVNADMTRKQLYKLFGDTYGQPLSGQNGFLATYIVENRYIYSVSVYNDDTNDSSLGYDGQALLNSLENNSRTTTTSRGMTVSAKNDFDPSSGSKGLDISINYKGKYSCSMDGFNIYSKNKAVNPTDKLTGSVKLTVDLLNPISEETVLTSQDETTTVSDTTTATTKATAKAETTTKTETTAKAESTSEAETTTQTEETTAAASNHSGNYLVGMLEITNDADESVYVEIYSIGDTLYICRVRQ